MRNLTLLLAAGMGASCQEGSTPTSPARSVVTPTDCFIVRAEPLHHDDIVNAIKAHAETYKLIGEEQNPHFHSFNRQDGAPGLLYIDHLLDGEAILATYRGRGHAAPDVKSLVATIKSMPGPKVVECPPKSEAFSPPTSYD